jgi:cyclophilin family peptidyl-prolyl cis-trans isomerase
MKTIVIALFLITYQTLSFGQFQYDRALLTTKAPEHFEATFTTTRGEFKIEVIRKWSPEGADRLYQLILSGFYNDNCLFRVQPEYVIQFGISDSPEVNAFWEEKPIPDEPVQTSNVKGTIAYARDGAETRTTQLFINVNDNYKLDTVMFNGLRGFAPVGRIIKGYEVVEKFYSGYGFEPANHQDSAMVKGNAYWKEHFPELDYILEAAIGH